MYLLLRDLYTFKSADCPEPVYPFSCVYVVAFIYFANNSWKYSKCRAYIQKNVKNSPFKTSGFTNYLVHLILKVQITTAAEDIFLLLLFLHFSKYIKLDITCETLLDR